MAKRMAFVVGGLLFGDEGKGTTVDYLVRKFEAHTVVRYNGGSQAGHNVVTPEGLHHCFAQFGSGTLVSETLTYLSQFMFVDPLRLISEWEILTEKGIKDALERLIISDQCPVITPFHKFAGQLRELARGTSRFGSCGLGVGEAISDYSSTPEECLIIRDLAIPDIVEGKLRRLQKNKTIVAESILKTVKTVRSADLESCFEEIRSESLWERCCRSYQNFSEFPIKFDDGALLKEILDRPGSIIFEGAQGALLDRSFGFKPFVTKSDCTFANAEKILFSFRGKIIKLGVMRAYATRHGNGPLVTEDGWLVEKLSDPHNVEGDWQGKFRVGWFDLVALKYGFDILQKLDGVVLTNFDRIQNLDFMKVCVAYLTREGKNIKELSFEGNSQTDLISSCRPVYQVFKRDGLSNRFLGYLRKNIPYPLVLISQGPTFLGKRDFSAGLVGSV